MIDGLKVIAFDADDTLWVNEPYFHAVEQRFCDLLGLPLADEVVKKRLFEIEVGNIPLYGYGVKSYILSMVEAAIELTAGQIDNESISEILSYGRWMLEHPVELIGEIEIVLAELQKSYRLVVVTKGDLQDQERKLADSGLEKYFHHIEIVSDKNEHEYCKLIQHLDIQPAELLMVGNSLKSDVLPVLQLGGHAVYLPNETSWAHERVDGAGEFDKFIEIDRVDQLLDILK